MPVPATIQLADGTQTEVEPRVLIGNLNEGDIVRAQAPDVGPVEIETIHITGAGLIVGYSEDHNQHYTVRPEDIIEVQFHDERQPVEHEPSPLEKRIEALVEDAHEVRDELKDVPGIDDAYRNACCALGLLCRVRQKVRASEAAHHPRPAEAL